MGNKVTTPRKKGRNIWAIDPGNVVCGVAQLLDRRIGHCFNEQSVSVYEKVMSLCGDNPIEIVIEDVFPFSMRLTPEIIATCKVIGELTYRFSTNPQVISVTLLARNSVKRWIFDTFPDAVTERIEKKMVALHNRKIKQGKRGLVKKTGEMYSPSFHYVDDRTVIAAMKSLFDIPTPKPGKRNIYGLVDHSWQALACGAYHYHNHQKSNNISS